MTSAERARDPSPLIVAAMAAQRLIFRTLLGETIPAWTQLDLSIGQLKTLMTLAVQQPLTVSALAEQLGLGKSATSILVDRLVHLGYVARTEDPSDRRRVALALTAAGDELVVTLRQGAGENRYVRWLEQMTTDDLAALTRGLEALAAIAVSAGPPSDPDEHC